MKLPSSLSALVCLLLPTAVFAQSVPVNRTEILGRLVYKSSPSSVAHLVKQRGIDFTPDDSFLTQVKRAGGEGILADRLFSEDYKIDETSGKTHEAPVEHMAKCSELIHIGAIELAEAECRAAIKENPQSPWPLLLTASLVERNAVDTVPADISDTSEEDAVSKEAEDLRNRAAALDPQGVIFNGLEWVDVEAEKFLSRPGAATPQQLSLSAESAKPNLDPELGSSHRTLALAFFAAQDWEQVRHELEEAIRLEPAYPFNHRCLANFYLSGQNENAAIAELSEAVRLAPFDTDLRQTLSATFENLGRTPEAIEELKNLLDISPGNVAISDKLVELFLKHKDRKSAIAELQRSLRESSLRYNDDDRLIEVRYNDLERLGDLLSEDRQFDAAVAQYQFLLSHRPEDSDWHNDYGNVLSDQNRLDEAIGEYRRALQLEPTMAAAHHNLGLCLARKKDLDAAIGEFRQSLELGPNNSLTQIHLGIALAQKGDLKAAKELLQRCIEKNPKDPLAHANLGYLLNQLKDALGAIKELRLALELNPDVPDVENDLAWIYATAANQQLRNPAEALALARKAVKDSPDPVPAFLDTLAEALLLNGQPAEALKTEQQAASLDPDNPEMRNRLAHFQAAASPTSAAKH